MLMNVVGHEAAYTRPHDCDVIVSIDKIINIPALSMAETIGLSLTVSMSKRDLIDCVGYSIFSVLSNTTALFCRSGYIFLKANPF